jgi:hypothetical protein
MKCYLWKKLTLVTTIFTMLWSRGKKMIIYKVEVLFKTVKKLKKSLLQKDGIFLFMTLGTLPDSNASLLGITRGRNSLRFLISQMRRTDNSWIS